MYGCLYTSLTPVRPSRKALVTFFRKFGEDTPDTRSRAARTMQLVYGWEGWL